MYRQRVFGFMPSQCPRPVLLLPEGVHEVVCICLGVCLLFIKGGMSKQCVSVSICTYCCLLMCKMFLYLALDPLTGRVYDFVCLCWFVFGGQREQELKHANT